MKKLKKGQIVFIQDAKGRRKLRAVKAEVKKISKNGDFEVKYLEDGIELVKGTIVSADLRDLEHAGHIALTKSELKTNC